MRANTSGFVGFVVALSLVGGMLYGLSAQTRTVTGEQFDRWMTELSNWGRWGVEDELGTLNLITPEKRIQAASLVRAGITVSLSNYTLAGPPPSRSSDIPLGVFRRGFDHSFGFGPAGFGARFEWFEEQHRIGYHASPVTHRDALCHVAWDGMTYNGRKFDETATADGGCTRNAVGPLRNGIVTRGLLMDRPGGGLVDRAAIEAWEQSSGLTIAAGDALFLRTGGRGEGGYAPSIMPFIRERDIAILVGDDGVDGGPVEGRTPLPMHVFALVALGMPLVDGVNLDAVAETAARVKRWEFMFVVSPLPVYNGVGSAVNPVALF